ncbi:General substrate transporter [Mycena indigotica]|uniref:General substrate transporter n=1 Tax=Mycena indigotica TaxID=2126181 RepID=A0A8H6TEV4_9AGAR|nr:General substrate transporter [Mycena indigotica]KAF7316433.1 General substrate transporter [Mycena indigotica]
MASLGDALFGYSQGVTAAFQVQPNFDTKMFAQGRLITTENIKLRETEIPPILPAVFVSCINLSALCAALVAPSLDPLGRRNSIRIGAFIYLVASIIQMFSPNLISLTIGRIVQGFGTGLLSTIVPIYQVEIAPAHARGMFISLETFWMNAGYCASSWIGYAFYFDMRGDDSWRGPYGIQAVISLLLFVWTFYLPETPRWLIQNGFKTEGLWTLADLHASGDVTDESVTRTFYEIEDTIALEQRNGNTAPWKDLFRQYTRRTVIAWMAQMLAQLNGINALLHFLPETLAHAGFEVSQALFWSSVCSVFYLIGTIPAILFIDRVGRRPFLLVGSISLALSLALVGSLKLVIERWPTKISVFKGAHGVVGGMSCYLFFFAATWGPIPWLLGAELFPLKLRSKGMALSTISEWLFEFIVAFATPSTFESLRATSYFVLVGFCLFSWVVVWLVFVETGMTTLEEIGAVFGDEVVPQRILIKDEDDLVQNLQRQRTRGHTALSMDSAVTQMTRVLSVASRLTRGETQHTTAVDVERHGQSLFPSPAIAAATSSEMTLTPSIRAGEGENTVEKTRMRPLNIAGLQNRVQKSHQTQRFQPSMAQTDNYSREALKQRNIPFMTLSTEDNPLTAPITRRDSESLVALTPSEIARRRFTISGNAIVTGGAGMLALEAARTLLEHGASGVALFDLEPSFVSKHAREEIAALKKSFPTSVILEKAVDVTKEEDVKQSVAECVNEFDAAGIQILLCFAGVVGTIHAEEIPISQFRRMLEINTTGSWICAEAVGKQMIKQNSGGSIVFTASISAHAVNFPQPQVAYNVSKGALLQLKSSLAAEWAKYGIRVNSISPGYCDTILNEGDGLAEARAIWKSRNPMGRMADPTELSGVVVLLCSPAGRYINGADIVVDGGGSVF